MADNVNITAGTGTPIATDYVGTTHYQQVKLDAGGDGVSVPVTAGAGLPVIVEQGTILAGTINNLASGSVVVTAATISAMPNVTVSSLPAITGAVSVITNGTIANIQGGSVVVTAGTIASLPAVTLANPGTITTGSIVVTAGTITEMPNLTVTTMPVMVVSAATVTAGTINNLAGGSIVMTVGTISAMPTGGYTSSANFLKGVSAAIAGTDSTQVIASPGTGNYIYLTNMLVTNASSGSSVTVNIQSGSAGDVIWTGFAAKDGGGFACTFPVPIITGQGSALFAQCSGSASVVVAAAGYKV